MKTVIEDLTATSSQESILRKIHNKFLNGIKTSVYADGYLFYKGDSFFPRRKHLSCMVCSASNPPIINTREINRLYSSKSLKKTTSNAFGRRKSITADIHCYGHLLADFYFHTIAYHIKKYNKLQPIPKDYIFRIAINKFTSTLRSNSSMYNYYKGQFA